MINYNPDYPMTAQEAIKNLYLYPLKRDESTFYGVEIPVESHIYPPAKSRIEDYVDWNVRQVSGYLLGLEQGFSFETNEPELLREIENAVRWNVSQWWYKVQVPPIDNCLKFTLKMVIKGRHGDTFRNTTPWETRVQDMEKRVAQTSQYLDYSTLRPSRR